jgi:uridine kinase
LIGITGGTASGKTSFIRDLGLHFDQSQIVCLSLDHYYYPKQQIKLDENGVHNFDVPSAINSSLLLQDMQSLVSGHSVQKLEHNFYKPGEQPKVLTFNPARVIIVEGIFACYFDQIRKMFDLTVYLHVDEQIMLARRLHRDLVERGFDNEDVEYRWGRHILPAYKEFIEPRMGDSDLVIPNNGSYSAALQVLVCYLKENVLKSH